MDLFGEQRSASDGRGTTTAKKPRFENSPVLQPSGQLQDIAADRIADFYRSIGVRKFANIARIAEMIEERFAKHQEKYGNQRETVQPLAKSGSAMLFAW